MSEFIASLTPGQLIILGWGLVLTLSQAINTIGGAVEKITKLRTAANAPNVEQDLRISALEQRMDVAEMKLGRDFATFQDLEKSNAVTQRALLALLGHGLHGNNVSDMEAAERELKTYLTSHH